MPRSSYTTFVDWVMALNRDGRLGAGADLLGHLIDVTEAEGRFGCHGVAPRHQGQAAVIARSNTETPTINRPGVPRGSAEASWRHTGTPATGRAGPGRRAVCPLSSAAETGCVHPVSCWCATRSEERWFAAYRARLLDLFASVCRSAQACGMVV